MDQVQGRRDSRRRLWHRLDWIARHELALLLAVLAIVLGLWAFAELADEVTEGATQTIDERVVRAMREPGDLTDPVGPAWLEEIGRDLTALGGVALLTLTTLAAVGYLLLQRSYRAVWLLLVAVVGGALLSTALKNIFSRERPSIVPHLSHTMTAAFPSGHALLSAVVYLTLGTLLARLTPRWSVKVYFLCVGLLLSFLTGISRIYLGVHYPTDVLAGWTLGVVWALLCWAGARALQVRGKISIVPLSGDRVDDMAGHERDA